ncbi:uncharacterized protein EI90DRAFT_1993410 [Cantharellus anzutake]|uniref:uncharacterized protein n=1 Tax=Cantharellus anzutake TaxID=1750568 RepID=UPI0019075908|nr:uncharacterized protein EI90DRAFT_1993410 [Cantharellus anzutake]KAF8326078.1 hypothetical protein EI90DRAFT_1993410 [Cantharellus anzutake]
MTTLTDDTLHDARHLLETIKEEPEENDTGDETLCLPEQHSEEEDNGSFTQLVDHADEVEVGQGSVLPRDSSPPPQSPAGSFMSLSGSVSSISRVRIRSRPASLRFHTRLHSPCESKSCCWKREIRKSSPSSLKITFSGEISPEEPRSRRGCRKKQYRGENCESISIHGG